MDFEKELTTGIELVRERIERHGELKLSTTYKFNDRTVQYFLVRSGEKEIDFVLTHKFLTDLPGTKEYKEFLDEYVGLLEHRFQQPNPLDFYCRSGTAITLEIFWPFNAVANRAASYVRVNVEDLRTPTLIAKCAVLFGMDSSFPLHNPFDRQRAIVNCVRLAIDRQIIAFYATAAHPDQLQQIEVWSMNDQTPPARQTDIEQFVAGKVYWLGFRRAGRDVKVWTADPWDSEYLGVESAALRRAAQIQDARGILRVDAQDLAAPGKGLLIESSQFESEPTSQLALLGGNAHNVEAIRKLLGKLLPATVTVLIPSEQPLGGVSSSIRSLIERSDFVIFDVASDNPNTFFEIGFAQALKKKLLLLVPKDYAPKLPFQIASVLYLAYDSQDLSSLEQGLANYVQRYWGLIVRR